MPSRALKVLSVSDRIDSRLLEKDTYEKFKDIDLILSCGDLPYYHIEKLFQLYEVPVLYVRGNHDPRVEYGKSGPLYGPRGGIDLHNRVVILNDLIFVGFEGSLPYKDGPFLYSQSEMWQFVLGMVPRLVWNKLIHGRFVDVVIAHSPPFGIHDKDSNVHGGYKAFRWLIKIFKPAYFFHGHIHVYTDDQIAETVAGKTKVINTYGHRKGLLRPGQRHYTPKEKPYIPSLADSAEDFRDARRRAALENIWSTLTGTAKHLIQFQQVEEQLQYEQSSKLGLLDIPLDAIVGSVSRPNDFTRKFFPREAVDPGRWQRVKKVMDQAIRPIEVYQIDQTYFVLDGNHRVSVARQRGMNHIQAYVTKIESSVPLTPEDDIDDLIIKNQQVHFRKDTGLEELRPDLEFDTSFPGGYQQLREQISSHQLNLGQQHNYTYSYNEAAENWVEEVYLPVLQTVSQSGLLRDFPERTPTDLYIWLTQYQKEISEQYGWEIEPANAVDSLAAAYSNRLKYRWKRLRKNLFPRFNSQQGDIGNWRRIHLMPRKEGQVFSDILVALNGRKSGWKALEQAIIIAEIEGSRISTLHIHRGSTQQAQDQIKKGYLKQMAGNKELEAKFYIEEGEVQETLTQRALWNDLLIFSLEHPPGDHLAARLRSGIRSLVQTCPRPLLAVPAVTEMKHGLLAFDGSPKATEALYLAAYLAEKWGIELTVVTAPEDSAAKVNSLDKAREYLEARNIEAHYHAEIGSPAEVIFETQKIHGCDFLIVGGYGYQPMMEVLFGSTLNALLRRSDIPILICH
ncbi:MAG: universal stress protein [Anaerolineales bacterium]|nr:universal stress protein [Anaerolineales bacterium]